MKAELVGLGSALLAILLAAMLMYSAAQAVMRTGAAIGSLAPTFSGAVKVQLATQRTAMYLETVALELAKTSTASESERKSLWPLSTSAFRRRLKLTAATLTSLAGFVIGLAVAMITPSWVMAAASLVAAVFVLPHRDLHIQWADRLLSTQIHVGINQVAAVVAVLGIGVGLARPLWSSRSKYRAEADVRALADLAAMIQPLSAVSLRLWTLGNDAGRESLRYAQGAIRHASNGRFRLTDTGRVEIVIPGPMTHTWFNPPTPPWIELDVAGLRNETYRVRRMLVEIEARGETRALVRAIGRWSRGLLTDLEFFEHWIFHAQRTSGERLRAIVEVHLQTFAKQAAALHALEAKAVIVRRDAKTQDEMFEQLDEIGRAQESVRRVAQHYSDRYAKEMRVRLGDLARELATVELCRRAAIRSTHPRMWHRLSRS